MPRQAELETTINYKYEYVSKLCIKLKQYVIAKPTSNKHSQQECI